ncbi:hypothetical protein O181_019805 [Austropuccinia psidii MF-1]|uniref:Reverse transcriptase domain-containing protein n=1 Tax=Austropuccinia psidii MF-1 TaxID=1389203 RepID=A0A9Q3CCK5_9BASI|nr:hypothetical protein [Austropuccinia psidii MF-1]
MPVKHSPPAKYTRYQRNQAVLTPTERAPLDHTPSFHQLCENLERGPPMEGEEPSIRGDTRYHERQKEKGSHQEKNPQIIGSNSFKPSQDSPKGEELILGYDFLYHFNPIVDWRNGLITYDFSHKDSISINSSTSNDFATSVKSAALVGELKTPSLPPSVHIPSIIHSQSLLQSRDEFFKEIGDVGEDVSISSLHLFQGDMELSPLSFHASLEEKWDEEEDPEEIEIVLKVVAPAYHQYLDFFGKVKEEKLPPHCTCDHHIELEALLPPVGVIYSLSNHESETMQAYISKNVEKGFVRPSSSSTGAPVLCVKKKDGGLCLCVDYCKLNAVTRKNRYPVPPMNQLLTIFNSSTIFSKIVLCGAYNPPRIKKGMRT